MERIAGLREYVAWKQYRSALGLPDQVTEEYRMLAQGEDVYKRQALGGCSGYPECGNGIHGPI